MSSHEAIDGYIAQAGEAFASYERLIRAFPAPRSKPVEMRLRYWLDKLEAECRQARAAMCLLDPVAYSQAVKAQRGRGVEAEPIILGKPGSLCGHPFGKLPAFNGKKARTSWPRGLLQVRPTGDGVVFGNWSDLVPVMMPDETIRKKGGAAS